MKFNSLLPIAVVIVAIAVSTTLQGRLTDRWPFAPPRTARLETFSERLSRVPKEIGPWKAEEVPLDEKEFKASNCDRGLSRIYRNEATGESVNVYLVSGVGRHVTIHTPDWCYRGAGFAMEGDMEPFTLVKASDVEFLSAGFRKEDVTGNQRLRIFWGFSDDGHWRGPRQPKPEFGGRPALYKVYLIHDAGEAMHSNKLQDSPAIAFAEEFMPIVNQALFTDGPVGSAPASPAAEPTASNSSDAPVDAQPTNADAAATSSSDATVDPSPAADSATP